MSQLRYHDSIAWIMIAARFAKLKEPTRPELAMQGFGFLIFKYLVTAAIIVAVSELVKVSGKLGALIAALPTVTILILIWMYIENQPQDRIADHAWYTLWYVIPTLPMFVAFPWLYHRLSFWPSLGLSCLLTLFCFALFIVVMRRLGIDLA